MTREIGFRAYIKSLEGLNKPYFEKVGRIFDVTSIDFENKVLSIRCPSQLDFSFDDVVLLQFTGLRDKNGKEIYEGDIVKRGTTVSDIIWEDFSFRLRKGNLVSDVNKPIEVIGNIYEHPNLLGKE